MDNLIWIDFIFLALFAFSTMVGFGRGLIRELIGVATLVGAVFIAATFAQPVAQSFTSSPGVQGVVTQVSTMGVDASKPISYAAIGVSFGLLFAGTMMVGTVIGFIVNLIFSFGIVGFGNRVLGAIFGFARGFIINLVIIFMVQMSAMGEQPIWQASVIVQYYQPYVAMLGSYVAPGIAKLKAKAGESMQNAGSSLRSLTN